MSKVRYRLYVQDPDTEKWIAAMTSKHLKNICKRIGDALQLNPDYFTDKKRRKLKKKLVAESVDGRGKKAHELEEYKLTKNWQVKGFFGKWENFGK